MVYYTSSPQETQKLAKTLAKNYQQGGVIALSGSLGTGKTTFVQGLARELGIKEKLISPTFVLIRQYDIPQNHHGKFYHLDLYRLNNQQQIRQLGIEEILTNPQNIVVIEWAEKLADLKSHTITNIALINLGKNKRKITVN